MGRYLVVMISFFLVMQSAHSTEVKSIEPADVLAPTNQINLTGHIIGLSSRIRSETGEFDVLIANGLELSATSTLDLATLTVDTATADELYAGDTLHYATVEYIGGSGGRGWNTSENTIYEKQSGTSRHGIDLDNGDVLLGGRIVSTLTGGSTRGVYAVDLQQSRGSASQVASGTAAAIVGGEDNTASGDYSFAAGADNTASGLLSTVMGYLNIASGTSAAVVGGRSNSATAEEAFVGGGNGNEATGQHSTVSGGENNTASGQEATVSGGSGNTASGGSSYVAGGVSNTASGLLSTSLGGYLSLSSGSYSTCLGGFGPDATGSYSTTLGGSGPLASGDYGVALGGYNNTASGDYSIAAGRASEASHSYSFVFSATPSGAVSTADRQASWYVPGGFRVLDGGGDPGQITYADQVFESGYTREWDSGTKQQSYENAASTVLSIDLDDGNTYVGGTLEIDGITTHNGIVSEGGNSRGTDAVDLQTNRDTVGDSAVASGDYSAIGGGRGNTANDSYATVAGGYVNMASEYASVVAGGRSNSAGANYAAVLGGYQNTVTGTYASVLGGYNNDASGQFGVVLGGYLCAAGEKALAVGRKANASHTGSFVFGDSTDAEIASTQDDQATFRCNGGFRIVPRPSPPPTPVAGTMYMDSGDGNKLKVYDGSTWRSMW